MSSKNPSDNNNNDKNLYQGDHKNLNQNNEINKEKEKDESQIIDNKITQVNNQSLSNTLDEKEIYNIPISIGKSNSNDSKNGGKSEKQEYFLNQKVENKDNNGNEKNNPNNNDTSEQLRNEDDSEMHPTEGPIGMSSAAKDPEEYRHLRSIVSAFFNYQIDSLRDVSRMERDFKSLADKYIKRLSFDYKERIEKLKHAIWLNYSFLLKIADPYKNMFKLFKASSGEVLMEPLIVEGKDIVKMRSTLRLFIRDWAIDGIEEMI